MSDAAGALVLFAALWATICVVLSRSGGWHALASHYRATTPFLGTRLRFRSAQLGGWVGYNGSLTVGANREGLYLAVWPIFRIGHPPLFVPWSDGRASAEKRWVFEIAALRFAAEPAALLRISRRLAERLGQASGRTLL